VSPPNLSMQIPLTINIRDDVSQTMTNETSNFANAQIDQELSQNIFFKL